MTYNVHSCVGTDGVRSHKRIADVIATYAPDVVALQEVDVGRARSGYVDQAQLIADELRMQVQFHPALTLEQEKYGDTLLSSYPMQLRRAALLPTPPCRYLQETRGALWVSIEVDGVQWQVMNSHFGLTRVERYAQGQALLGAEWAGAVEAGRPLVVCGDFNSVAQGRTMRLFRSHLSEAQLAAPLGRRRATFPSRWPLICIDHIFCGDGVEVLSCEVPRTRLTAVASDHLPLIAEVKFASLAGVNADQE
jgi:endonuclease/exonuclease/phosphatase family metal-dependent hydrolase